MNHPQNVDAFEGVDNKSTGSNDTRFSYLSPPPYHALVHVKNYLAQLDENGKIPSQFRHNLSNLLKKNEV